VTVKNWKYCTRFSSYISSLLILSYKLLLWS
jgi:hypothetical protein